MRRLGVGILAACALVGCGKALVSQAAPKDQAGPKALAAGSLASAARGADPVPAGDSSSLDLAWYLKIAKLYCFLHYNEAALDYAGSAWLNEKGLVLPRTAGWTFGYFYEPEMGHPGERAYAVLRVDQSHALTVGSPGDIRHRGTSPLYLGGMPSPRDAIHEALAQGLPRGDRYGIEYLSSDDTTAQMSLVSSYRDGSRIGERRI